MNLRQFRDFAHLPGGSFDEQGVHDPEALLNGEPGLCQGGCDEVLGTGGGLQALDDLVPLETNALQVRPRGESKDESHLRFLFQVGQPAPETFLYFVPLDGRIRRVLWNGQGRGLPQGQKKGYDPQKSETESSLSHENELNVPILKRPHASIIPAM